VFDAAGKTALDYARDPPHVGPGPPPPRGDDASRAATVALLAPLTPKTHNAETARATE
jgi:hypothetical protein